MLGVEKRIGASRYCRKCGGYHCMPNHHCGKGTVSPLQDAQMVIEDLEEFLVKAPIKIRAREEVEEVSWEVGPARLAMLAWVKLKLNKFSVVKYIPTCL